MPSRSWSRTQTRYVAAPPERVWDALATPSLWPAFDAAVQSFTPVTDPTLVGPGGPRSLREGEGVRVLPHARVAGSVHALTAPPAHLVSVRTDQELTWRQDQPGGFTEQSYSLWPSGSGTRMTRRTRTVGPLTPLLGPGFAAPLAADLGAVAARLYPLVTPATSQEPLVVIAGGSGLLGTRLAHLLLARGRDVVVLTRHPGAQSAYRQVRWDGATSGAWTSVLQDPRGVDIVNLSGSPIGSSGGTIGGFGAGRAGADAEMARLTSSRVNPTRALVAACSEAGVRVRHWVQGSGVVLRDSPDEPVVHEDSSPRDASGEALPGMTELVRRWEDAVSGAPTDHLTLIRTGIVLDREAPAFRYLALAAATGAGGALGSGRQFTPWIHVDDWMRIALAALGEAPDPEGSPVQLPDGPVIAAAPNPATNAEVMGVLRSRLAPFGQGVPAPASLIRVGTKLLGKDPAVVLGSANATSTVLPQAGFRFLHTDVKAAIADLLS